MRIVANLAVTLALAASLSAGWLEAADQPEDPILAALVEEALSRNPELLAARDGLAAARSRPAQARSLPDPMLSTAYTNDGVAPSLGERDMTTLAVMWSQDLPYPGKRGLRAELAARDADLALQQISRAELSLAAAVKRAYYGLLLSREVLKLITEQGENWKQIEGVTRARYAVGQGAQQDVLRVQVEVTRIEQLMAEQTAEGEIRLAELNRLAARAGDAALDTPEGLVLRPLAEAPAEVLDRLRALSPELRAAALAVERGRLAVALARRDFKPDFTIQAGYMNRGRLDPMWQASMGVRLPVYRARLKNALAETEARLRADEGRVAAAELALRYRTQERLAQIKASEKMAALYAKGIVPQDQMSVEAAIASYQAARVPFIAVLEALTTLYGDRTTYLRLLAGHAKARASLEEASLEATSDLAPMRESLSSLGAAGAGTSGMSPAATGSMGMR